MNNITTRSTFVTVVAWIFIVLSGFMTAISILQNIMIQTVFNRPEMERALHSQPPPGTPPFATFMSAHFQLFFFAFLIVSVATLVSSIGLLNRKNWARLVFVGLLVLGIVWNLGGMVLQFATFSSMQDSFVSQPGFPDMKPFFIAIVVVSVLFAVVVSGLFGWVVKRLLSPAVAAEFTH